MNRLAGQLTSVSIGRPSSRLPSRPSRPRLAGGGGGGSGSVATCLAATKEPNQQRRQPFRPVPLRWVARHKQIFHSVPGPQKTTLPLPSLSLSHSTYRQISFPIKIFFYFKLKKLKKKRTLSKPGSITANCCDFFFWTKHLHKNVQFINSHFGVKFKLISYSRSTALFLPLRFFSDFFIFQFQILKLEFQNLINFPFFLKYKHFGTRNKFLRSSLLLSYWNPNN